MDGAPSFIHCGVCKACEGLVQHSPAPVALPLYVVIQEYQRTALTLAVTLCTSAILKFTWYDHLTEREVETDKAGAND
jgi:hypothetical protein